MPSVNLDFIHRFVPAPAGGAPSPALLLLHGTGGDENDLLSLGAALAPGAPLLSPRGKVLENGMPRFFRRLREGVFDPREVEARAHELADFVLAAREMYPLGGKPIAVGLSNGANIAAALLLLRPEVLGGAILFRPMVALEPGVPGGRPAGSDRDCRADRAPAPAARASGRTGRGALGRCRPWSHQRGRGRREAVARLSVFSGFVLWPARWEFGIGRSFAQLPTSAG
jgi:predicted esterase